MRNVFPSILFFLFTATISFAQTTDELAATADSLLDEGNFSEALSLYDQLIAEDSSNEHYLRARGYSHIALNNFDKGESDIKKALEINPDCSACYCNLGRIEANRGNIDEAIELLNIAIEKDDKNDLAYLTRAKVKEYTNDQLGASLDYNKAIAVNPKEAANYIERGRYRLTSSMKTLALRDFNAAFDIDSNNVAVSYARAQYFTQFEDWENALLDFERCIKLDPTNYLYYGAKGTVFEFLGKHEEAIKNYDRSIELDDSKYLTFMNRAIAKYSIEEMDGFCQDNEMALKLIEKIESNQSTIDYLTSRIEEICDSNKKSYYYQRGIAKFNLGEFDEAVSYYEKGLKRFPNSPMLLSFQGNARRALGKDALAIGDYKAFLNHKDKLPSEVNESKAFEEVQSIINTYVSSSVATVYMNISECYANLGKYETAISYSDSAIRLLLQSKNKLDVAGLLASNYNTRGVIYTIMGEYEKSINDFEQAIRTDDSNPLPFTNMALAILNDQGGLKYESRSIGFHLHHNYNGIQGITMPIFNGNKIDRTNLLTALSSCDMAIELDGKHAFSYLVRAQVKVLLKEPGYCLDILTAKELGLSNAEQILGVSCE